MNISPSGTVTTPCNNFVEQINVALDRYTDFPEDCPKELKEAIRYSLLSPGKRLRPQMVLFASQACGGEAEPALPAACAVEMIHAYSLIHDDLPAMDDDDLRRGRPTCHKVYGEATAILAGDALLARAFEILALDIQPQTIAAKCVLLLANAAGATELVGGQADDLSGEKMANNLESLQAIHRRKTGAMFLVSLLLGGRIANASDAQIEALEVYGKCMGMAFQITDDLLDVLGKEEDMGKRLRKDDNRGKMTYPALLGVEASRKQAAELIANALDAIAIFGQHGEPLVKLAEAILNRNH